MAARKKSAKTATPQSEKQSEKPSDESRAQDAASSTEREAAQQPKGAAQKASGTVRLHLRRSVIRDGKVYGPGPADVPAALAESLKLGGATEVEADKAKD